MASVDLKIGMTYLSQTVVGILGNFSLLYMSLYFRGCRSRPTDLILRHLTVANSLVILSRGVPETMAALWGKHFANDFGCCVLLYVHRVGRGMSIGSTCLLSVFQAITISPWNSTWAELKVIAPKSIGSPAILCWVLHMLANVFYPVYTTGKKSNKNITKKNDFRYCAAFDRLDKVTGSVYAALTSFHDVLCLGLMLGASSSMVSILQRHKQRVQHIHRTSLCPRPSPETRAMQSILLLVTTFVLFYALSSSIYVYLALFSVSSWWLVTSAVLIAAGFPTISPFVLMISDPGISRLCVSAVEEITEPPHLFREP